MSFHLVQIRIQTINSKLGNNVPLNVHRPLLSCVYAWIVVNWAGRSTKKKKTPTVEWWWLLCAKLSTGEKEKERKIQFKRTRNTFFFSFVCHSTQNNWKRENCMTSRQSMSRTAAMHQLNVATFSSRSARNNLAAVVSFVCLRECAYVCADKIYVLNKRRNKHDDIEWYRKLISSFYCHQTETEMVVEWTELPRNGKRIINRYETDDGIEKKNEKK